jgi:hypothetical protein
VQIWGTQTEQSNSADGGGFRGRVVFMEACGNYVKVTLLFARVEIGTVNFISDCVCRVMSLSSQLLMQFARFSTLNIDLGLPLRA